MTRSYWHGEASAAQISCDVAIVGGGFLGVSTAFWLGRISPEIHVVLVESATLSSGASGRNAGFILQGAHSDACLDRQELGEALADKVWAFTQENRDRLFSEVDHGAVQLQESGALILSGSQEENERLRSAADLLAGKGVSAKYLLPDQVQRRVGGEGFLGGLYISSGGMVNPARLVRYLAYESGATLLEKARMIEHEAYDGGISVRSTRGVIQAERAAFCLGAKAVQYLEQAGELLKPKRAQMLATVPMRPWLNLPVYSHDGYFYVRQAPGGEVLVGGGRHLHEEAEVGLEDRTTDPVQREIERYMSRHFPNLQDISVSRRWSGTMAFSPDRLPLYAELPGAPGSFWMGGCTGHGMAYGFRLGLLMARLLTGRADEYASVLSADRFRKG